MNQPYRFTIAIGNWQLVTSFIFIVILHMTQFLVIDSNLKAIFKILSYLALICYTVVVYSYDFRDWRIIKDDPLPQYRGSSTFQKFKSFGFFTMFAYYTLGLILINFLGFFISQDNPNLLSYYSKTRSSRTLFVQLVFFIIIVVLPIVQKIIESNLNQFKYSEIKLKPNMNYKLLSVFANTTMIVVFVTFAVNFSSYYYENLPQLDPIIQKTVSFALLYLYILLVPIMVYINSNSSLNIIPNFSSPLARVAFVVIFSLFFGFSIYSFFLNVYVGMLLVFTLIGYYFFFSVVATDKQSITDEELAESGLLIASIIY